MIGQIPMEQILKFVAMKQSNTQKQMGKDQVDALVDCNYRYLSYAIAALVIEAPIPLRAPMNANIWQARCPSANPV